MLYWFLDCLGINRAWLCKDPKGFEFQHVGGMQDLKVKGVRGAWIHFSRDSVESMEFKPITEKVDRYGDWVICCEQAFILPIKIRTVFNGDSKLQTHSVRYWHLNHYHNAETLYFW